MSALAQRVVARFLEARAYTRNPDLIPAYAEDSDRVVYVKPESVGEGYQKVPENELDSEGHLADPRRPGGKRHRKYPRRPHKPEIPREPPPTVVAPPRVQPPPLPPKRPKPVPPVPLPKVPKPSPKRQKRHVRKFDYRWASSSSLLAAAESHPDTDPIVLRVVQRFLRRTV